MDSDGELPEQHDLEQSVIDALPALARVAAAAWLRTAVWGLETSLRVGERLARATVDPGSAMSLVQDVGAGMRAYARELLGISDLDERVRQLMPASNRYGPASAARARRAGRNSDGADVPLRALGAELLRQSADVTVDDETHPAHARILEQLAPDEGRILRVLAVEGPQPVVDVRAANLVGVGSQLVQKGLNMVGSQAGCRHPDRIPSYLNNLERLGLIWFSSEPVDDAIAYQVLEAQPNVLHAIKETSRAKTAHRSIRLTPFGQDFCDVVLPRDTSEIEALTADAP